jgi:hypothetical protein
VAAEYYRIVPARPTTRAATPTSPVTIVRAGGARCREARSASSRRSAETTAAVKRLPVFATRDRDSLESRKSCRTCINDDGHSTRSSLSWVRPPDSGVGCPSGWRKASQSNGIRPDPSRGSISTMTTAPPTLSASATRARVWSAVKRLRSCAPPVEPDHRHPGISAFRRACFRTLLAWSVVCVRRAPAFVNPFRRRLPFGIRRMLGIPKDFLASVRREFWDSPSF